MIVSLHEILQQLRRITSPEALFGELPQPALEALKRQYRRLATQTHPDHHPYAKYEAEEAFKLLQRWHQVALRKIEQGTYGKKALITIASPMQQYAGYEQPLKGDLCDLFPAWSEGGEKVLLKINRHVRNNDLLQAEVQSLKRLERALGSKSKSRSRSKANPLRAHFPTLVEHFKISDEANSQRQTNVLQVEADYVTLEQVIEAYPTGLHPADMAWMFNRVLAALGVSHEQGIIHGAVVPAHIMIRPPDHNGMLIDWCYSVKVGQTIKAVSPSNKAYYPPEVFAKLPATAATDIYMAASCMVRLLGGDVASGTLPHSVPKPIKALLRVCLIPSPHRRVNDAWELFEDFGKILRRLYGPPTFRPFKMSKFKR